MRYNEWENKEKIVSMRRERKREGRSCLKNGKVRYWKRRKNERKGGRIYKNNGKIKYGKS